MLRGTHINDYSTIAKSGQRKGQTIRVHVYTVSGTVKELTAYNEAMLKAAAERGVEAANVARDKANNCLYYFVPNWQTGNTAQKQIDLKVTFNGYVTLDRTQAIIDRDNRLAEKMEDEMAKRAADREFGLNKPGITTTTSTPAEKPAETVVAEPAGDALAEEIAELQKTGNVGQKTGSETLAQ